MKTKQSKTTTRQTSKHHPNQEPGKKTDQTRDQNNKDKETMKDAGNSRIFFTPKASCLISGKRN